MKLQLNLPKLAKARTRKCKDKSKPDPGLQMNGAGMGGVGRSPATDTDRKQQQTTKTMRRAPTTTFSPAPRRKYFLKPATTSCTVPGQPQRLAPIWASAESAFCFKFPQRLPRQPACHFSRAFLSGSFFSPAFQPRVKKLLALKCATFLGAKTITK